MSENIILRVDDLPVQQNRVYSTAQETVDCPKGNVLLVQNQETGIVHNSAFRPELVIYDHWSSSAGAGERTASLQSRRFDLCHELELSRRNTSTGGLQVRYHTVDQKTA